MHLFQHSAVCVINSRVSGHRFHAICGISVRHRRVGNHSRTRNSYLPRTVNYSRSYTFFVLTNCANKINIGTFESIVIPSLDTLV